MSTVVSAESPSISKQGRASLPFAMLCLAALLFAGCALISKPRTQPTRFYVLTAAQTNETGKAGRNSSRSNEQISPAAGSRTNFAVLSRHIIGVRPVEVPSYLQPKAIAVRKNGNEILYAQFNHWAESLQDGIARVLAGDLRLQPNIRDAWQYPYFDGAQPEFELKVSVMACEGVVEAKGHGGARFAAIWRVSHAGKVIRTGSFNSGPTAWNQPDFGQLARKLSQAVAELAKRVAGAIPVSEKAQLPK
jgi:uncharacterized lipoprotein YmbA